MLLPEYTNNVLVHCMQKSSHRQQEVCKKDLKQKKCNFFAWITLDTIQTRWNCEKQLVGF